MLIRLLKIQHKEYFDIHECFCYLTGVSWVNLLLFFPKVSLRLKQIWLIWFKKSANELSLVLPETCWSMANLLTSDTHQVCLTLTHTLSHAVVTRSSFQIDTSLFFPSTEWDIIVLNVCYLQSLSHFISVPPCTAQSCRRPHIVLSKLTAVCLGWVGGSRHAALLSLPVIR